MSNEELSDLFERGKAGDQEAYGEAAFLCWRQPEMAEKFGMVRVSVDGSDAPSSVFTIQYPEVNPFSQAVATR
jgi:hypothetical protein